MQVTHNGSIFCQPLGAGKFRFEFWPVDGSKGGFSHLGTFVQVHTIEFEVADEFDPRPGMVADLEREKQELTAKFQKRITELSAQIQSLLAIENKPSEVAS